MPKLRKPTKSGPKVSGIQLAMFTSVSYNKGIQTGAEDEATSPAPSQNREGASIMAKTYTNIPDSPSQIADSDDFQPSKRKTYPQNWPAYNAAQTSEKDTFHSLLANLCSHVQQPTYTFGRPRFPLADMVYVGAIKVYSGFSARRFNCDVQEACRSGIHRHSAVI